MSYIDTFDHEFLGFFGGIPVYRPLVDVEGSYDDYDFGCKTNHVIIGGGSGEHPAILFISPEIAVARFVGEWMMQVEDDKRFGVEKLKAMIQEAGGKYEDWDAYANSNRNMAPAKNFVRFAGWETKDHSDFYALCQSPALMTPLPKDRADFNGWLAACIGELIFFSLPELTPSLEKDLPGVRSCIRYPILSNVLTHPPGFGCLYGRITGKDKVLYGYPRPAEKKK